MESDLTHYTKNLHGEPSATPLFFITVGRNDGPSTNIVCERMYEWAADWLIEMLEGHAYPGGPN